MLQLSVSKKKKKKRGPHVLSISTPMITSTHTLFGKTKLCFIIKNIYCYRSQYIIKDKEFRNC